MKTIILFFIIILSHFATANKLKFISRTPLIETDSIIIGAIDKCSFSKDLKQYLITDYSGNQFFLVDSKTGKIIKIFYDFLDYSDSMATNLNANLKGDFTKHYFLSYKEAVDTFKMYKSYKKAKNWLKTQVKDAIFKDSTIVFSLVTKCFAFNLRNDTIINSYVESQYSLLTYDIKTYKLLDYHLIDQIKNTCFFRPTSLFFLSPDTLLGILGSQYNYLKNIKDSIWSFGKHVLSKNKNIGLKLLPEEFIDSHLGYMFHQIIFLKNYKNEILLTYSILPFIYNVTLKQRYYLDNLRDLNKVIFDSLKKNNKLNTYKEYRFSNKLIFPLFIYNFAETNDGYLLFWRSLDTLNKQSFINISFYDRNYNIQNEIRLPFENKYGSLFNIFFIKKTNSFLFVRKSKVSGFLFELYKLIK